MNTWLIADTHFFHENVIKYCNRPFIDERTKEQKELSQIAHKIFAAYPCDGKYILNGKRLIICQSNAATEDLRKEYDLEIHELIENEYILPKENFKNPIKSRFREAYQLIKKKEHGSLKEAIELGFELMFQSDLNPAVIAAVAPLWVFTHSLIFPISFPPSASF